MLHPVAGPLLLAAVLFLMFQAVFSWAEVPMDASRTASPRSAVARQRDAADGPLRSLLTDGVIAGAGSVLVFLPQILILFFFILVLEDSGYLPRAAFLLDRLMGKRRAVGPRVHSACSRVSRARFPASWPRAPSPLCATASPPS